MPVVGIVGGSSVSAGDYELARKAGRRAAQKGALVVCGGLSGVMEAACRGAKEGGGVSVAVLPGKEKSAANKYASIAVPTGIGEARNVIIVNMADGLIAVDGKHGTLSEIAFALKKKKPVFGVRSFDIKGIIKEDDPEKAVDRLLAKLKAAK